MKILLNLIGEQPIPNLLPGLFLKPDKTVFLFTDTTQKRANQLKEIVSNSELVRIFPYDFNKTYNILSTKFDNENTFVCNITGGTKIMSLALFQLALANNAEIVYLRSEENTSSIYSYTLQEDNNLNLKINEIPELITAEEYLKAHIPYYYLAKQEKNPGTDFENLICSTLENNGFEVLQNVKPKGEGEQLEIDAVIRLKGTNNVGIAEIKIGDKEMKNPKKGIDQLGLASQREYLGTYTKRFLITQRKLTKEIKVLAKAHKIIIIDEIEQERRTNRLTEKSVNKLIERITGYLS